MNPLILDAANNLDPQVIVALDFNTEQEVMNLVKQLDPNICKLKIGKELFTTYGPKLVERLVISGYKIFLDLKFYDIPHTVYKACKAACNLGVWMINVHASGGIKMLEAARKGVDEMGGHTLLTGVTLLTSFTQNDLSAIGIHENINTHIINLAKLSHNTGLDGVVCSAREATTIKAATAANFLTITPGIRLTADVTDDQQRIMTPCQAINNKADYIVIGRPITQAQDPHQQLLTVLADIEQSI